MKTCNSCGGAFDEALPKCPFCGTLNEEGAEKDYNKRLDNIRKKLDVVDDLAVDDYKNEVRLFFRVFLISAFVFTVIALLWWNAFLNKDKPFTDKRAEADKAYAQMKEEHDLMAYYDSLFDAGKYDELVALTEERGYGGALYSWKHYRFCALYSDLERFDNDLAKLTAGESPSWYTYSNVLYTVIDFRNTLSGKSGNNIPEEDLAVLTSAWEGRDQKAVQALGMTEEEVNALWEEATPKSYIQYSTVSDYAKERWGK